MRIATISAVLITGAMLTACGGSSTPPAGEQQAAAACKTSGTQAAQLASQAATANSKYATLAADENALVAGEGTQANELAGSGDNSGLVGAEALTSPGGIKVLTDCTTLGLPVPH